MTLSSAKAAFVTRMDQLIERANQIRAQGKVIQKKSANWVHDRTDVETYVEYDDDSCKIWQHHFTTLVEQLLETSSLHWVAAKHVVDAGNRIWAVDNGRLLLMALKEDLEAGFLDRLILRVQAESAADYLGMAESLLQEGARGQNDHIPAAVLAGAVLEHSLRDLCSRRSPPIPIVKSNG